MSAAIWKTKLPITSQPILTVPKGSTLISTKLQYGEPQVWFYVPDTEETETKDINLMILGTGHPAPEPDAMAGYALLDTLIMENDSLVLHVLVKVD